jgi:hypothetical protein
MGQFAGQEMSAVSSHLSAVCTLEWVPESRKKFSGGTGGWGGASRRSDEPAEGSEEVGGELEEAVKEEAGGVLVGVVTVEVGEDQAGAAEDDVKAELAAAAEGAEFGVEAADLGGVEEAQWTLPEAAAVAEDASGAERVGEAEDDAVAGGADGGGLGAEAESTQRGYDPGAVGGREHWRSLSVIPSIHEAVSHGKTY